MKDLLPPYPRIPHLPHNPNASQDDIIASNDTAKIIWESKTISVQEKADGANLAVAIIDGHPVMRNRDKFLSKATIKKTAAKQQFKYCWNWVYEHKKQIEQAGEYSFYGEWLLAAHGVQYNRLADWFYVYDVLDQNKCLFLDTLEAQKITEGIGLSFIKPLHYGSVENYDQLIQLAEGNTALAQNEQREGIVVKVSDGKFITHLFKMVRTGYEPGKLWKQDVITKNKLEK